MDFPIFHKSQNEIKSIQLQKIQSIVKIAYEKSDFYHQLYLGAGFHPDMLKTYEDIQKIPIVKRSALKDAPTESILTRRDLDKLHLHTTSGSSGIPVKFYYDAGELRQKNYGVMRAYLKMGIKLRDVTVALRDPIDIRKPGIYEKIGIMAYDYYNTYDPISEICNGICEKSRDHGLVVRISEISVKIDNNIERCYLSNAALNSRIQTNKCSVVLYFESEKCILCHQ